MSARYGRLGRVAAYKSLDVVPEWDEAGDVHLETGARFPRSVVVDVRPRGKEPACFRMVFAAAEGGRPELLGLFVLPKEDGATLPRGALAKLPLEELVTRTAASVAQLWLERLQRDSHILQRLSANGGTGPFALDPPTSEERADAAHAGDLARRARRRRVDRSQPELIDVARIYSEAQMESGRWSPTRSVAREKHVSPRSAARLVAAARAAGLMPAWNPAAPRRG
jgi:hypothetical protein